MTSARPGPTLNAQIVRATSVELLPRSPNSTIQPLVDSQAATIGDSDGFTGSHVAVLTENNDEMIVEQVDNHSDDRPLPASRDPQSAIRGQLRGKAVEAIQSLIEGSADADMAQSIVDRLRVRDVLSYLATISSEARELSTKQLRSDEDGITHEFSLWVLLQQVRLV